MLLFVSDTNVTKIGISMIHISMFVKVLPKNHI